MMAARPIHLGFVLVATDLTAERDFRRLLPAEGVRYFVTRAAYRNPMTRENLARTKMELSGAAALLVPDSPIDVVAYDCTSATVAMGPGTALQRLRDGRPEAGAWTTPIAALESAIQELGVRRINLLTPYSMDVTAPIQECLESMPGVTVPQVASFGLTTDTETAEVSPEDIAQAARTRFDWSRADALFVSCSALRAVEVIDELEASLGVPVLSSNQVVVWDALRLARWPGPVPGAVGQLMARLPGAGAASAEQH